MDLDNIVGTSRQYCRVDSCILRRVLLVSHWRVKLRIDPPAGDKTGLFIAYNPDSDVTALLQFGDEPRDGPLGEAKGLGKILIACIAVPVDIGKRDDIAVQDFGIG